VDDDFGHGTRVTDHSARPCPLNHYFVHDNVVQRCISKLRSSLQFTRQLTLSHLISVPPSHLITTPSDSTSSRFSSAIPRYSHCKSTSYSRPCLTFTSYTRPLYIRTEYYSPHVTAVLASKVLPTFPNFGPRPAYHISFRKSSHASTLISAPIFLPFLQAAEQICTP
jgi:hypothetical protein